MLVENYEQRWLPPSFNMRLVREDSTISKRAYARLCREAKEQLQGYGLDFSQLSGPELCFYGMLSATATWKHKISDQEVELTEIYFDQKTGEITQCGTSYGRLSL